MTTERPRQIASNLASVLGNFASIVETPRSLDDFVWEICQCAVEPLGLEDCVIYVVDETGSKLEQRAALGPKNPEFRTILNPITLEFGKGIVGSAARCGRPELVPDTTLDPRYVVDDETRLSELAVPIIDDGRVVGVIDSEHSTRGFFRDVHRDTLRAIAAMSAGKIARALEQGLSHTMPFGAAAQKSRIAPIQALVEVLGDRHNDSDQDVLSMLHDELRTPAAAVLGLARTLCEGDNGTLAPDALATVREIERSGVRLLNQLESLLELPALFQQRDQRVVGQIDIGELVEAVAKSFAPALERKAVALTVEVPDVVEPVYSDRRALESILGHLLDNAVKFTVQGEVTVRLLADETGRPSSISVIDTGIGIADGDLEQIFKPFRQLDSGLDRLYRGMGLGLSKAAWLATSLGNDLRVVSARGEGSTFELRLDGSEAR